jgi:hypothetical protein
LQQTSEVTYLKLNVDKGLTWEAQLKNMNKAYRAFWICKGTFGKTWGLKPKGGVLDLYHGDHTHIGLWLHGLVVKGQVRTELGKLQRLACLVITGYEDDSNSTYGGPPQSSSSSCDD